jgi:hypothetical protein
VRGSGKAVQIDLAKLREAITVVDTQVEEKEGSLEERKSTSATLENIDLDNVTEEEFLVKAVANIGEIKKTKHKTLEKDTFIRVFKYTGDLAKLRSKELKKKA